MYERCSVLKNVEVRTSGGTSPVDSLVMAIPVGSRVRFLRDIIEPACEDHPTFILARKGEKGTVVGESKTWGYSVKWDNWQSAAFGAKPGVDFEVIPRVLP